MPYPGGVGGPTAQPIPRSSCLRLAFVFLSVRETWKRENFSENKKNDILGTFGGSPILSPEGGSALPRAESRLTQCCARVRAPVGSDDF